MAYSEIFDFKLCIDDRSCHCGSNNPAWDECQHCLYYFPGLTVMDQINQDWQKEEDRRIIEALESILK